MNWMKDHHQRHTEVLHEMTAVAHQQGELAQFDRR